MSVKRTILLADDAAMFRELGAVFLARTGRVVSAANGYQSLDLLHTEKPSVIVADLDMPCMDGEELCRRIKSDPETAHLPVILVTSTDDGHQRAVSAGADDVIAKPISRIMLIQAVNRFLSEQPVRGLTRVTLDAPVHIVHPREHHWGVVRNLSRGGLYVEAGTPMAPSTEVSLEFELPDDDLPLAPTARVVWRREGRPNQPAGMGLQFLSLDRESADRLDSFVYQHADFTPPHVAAAAGGSG